MKKVLRKVKDLLPPSMRARLATRYRLVVRNLETGWDRRNGMSPPWHLQRPFGEGSQRTARRGVRRIMEVGGLEASDDVLEVGSGYGMMAIALTRYLSPQGSYCGLEPVRAAFAWCRNRITPRYPNFRFEHADLWNKFYNPNGRQLPHEYTFPFEDNSFDFVFLSSVFTHMLPRDVERYIAEVARVLRPGGRCWATFFLLNEESRRLIEAGQSSLPFQHPGEGYVTIDPAVPEAAIAFEETFLRALMAQNDLEIQEPIRYGSWCRREDTLTYQDVVIATKPLAKVL